jgi:hypothetical protein
MGLGRSVAVLCDGVLVVARVNRARKIKLCYEKPTMSLDTMTLWPFRYTLKCDARDDLDPALGSLPDHSLYIGSSNNVSNRLCFHFQSDAHGTQFTKRFQPREVVGLCVRRPSGTRECLAWEDQLVVDQMFRFMQEYTHPEAWRCVAGGSWSKPSNSNMPWPLRIRLRTVAANKK